MIPADDCEHQRMSVEHVQQLRKKMRKHERQIDFLTRKSFSGRFWQPLSWLATLGATARRHEQIGKGGIPDGWGTPRR